MSAEWELLRSEPLGLVGRRRIIAKTFRLPDGCRVAVEEGARVLGLVDPP